LSRTIRTPISSSPPAGRRLCGRAEKNYSVFPNELVFSKPDGCAKASIFTPQIVKSEAPKFQIFTYCMKSYEKLVFIIEEYRPFYYCIDPGLKEHEKTQGSLYSRENTHSTEAH